MAELGYFRRQQLIENITRQLAASQGWETVDSSTQESSKRQKNFPLSDYIVVGTVIVNNATYKREAQYNKFYDLAEKLVDTVLAAITEDSQNEEE